MSLIYESCVSEVHYEHGENLSVCRPSVYSQISHIFERRDSYKRHDSYKSHDSYKRRDSYKRHDSYKRRDSYKRHDRSET